MPDDLGERHVLVNIPGYSLKALDKGEVALRMPVIVGSVERPTPVFSHRITHLVFNPTWTIPPTVARNDILPKLLRNPAYLKEHEIKLFDSWAPGARPINSRSVNWRDVGSRITRYRMRQDPGPKNSLGRIKFMFPNDFDVYLHDTPARDKFAQVERSLSSGCVRVSDPAALTAFLMEGMDDWPVERRTQVLDAGETKTVWLRQSVPVHLTYQTVYFDEAARSTSWKTSMAVMTPLLPPLPSAFRPSRRWRRSTVEGLRFHSRNCRVLKMSPLNFEEPRDGGGFPRVCKPLLNPSRQCSADRYR